MSGVLYGLGVGPGDPELLTLKAHRILAATPVVAYPAPDNGESFARSIVADLIPDEKTEIPIIIPMKQARFPAREIYDEAAAKIAAILESGEDVAVLCEGDPFFYGSFMYLYERLAGKCRIEIVPGVSSIMAAGAIAGRPLAARNDHLSVVPAPLDDAALKQKIAASDAVAIIKLGRHFERTRKLLEELGLVEATFYVERIGLEDQKILPLAQAGEITAPYFSMLLVYKGAENWIAGLSTGTGDGA